MVDWDDLLLLSAVQRTDDAYLQGDPTTLSARVPGYVHRVAVADMEMVKEGQVLYEIDDAEYRAQVDLARARVAEGGAQVAIAAAQIDLQERQIDVTQSNADLAQSDLIQAEQEQSRQNRLRGSPAFLLRTWEQATQNALALQATVAANRAIIASQTAQLKVLQATFKQMERICGRNRPRCRSRRSTSGTRACWRRATDGSVSASRGSVSMSPPARR